MRCLIIIWKSRTLDSQWVAFIASVGSVICGESFCARLVFLFADAPRISLIDLAAFFGEWPPTFLFVLN